MSADSPNHSHSELMPIMQNVVTPQPVTDLTILDSVAGFINDVVPTTGSDAFDSKDQIQWARFENLEWDESVFSPKAETPLPSSLILVLGYATGVQVWAIPSNGEAIELFSWRHGSVKVLRILPSPYDVSTLNKRDLFETKRPLIALVDATIHGTSGSLNFYSLKTSEQVKQIKFKNQILDVVANRRSVVITFTEKIAVFDAFTLEDKLSITSCYLSPGIQPNPVALGPRWLAFADKKLVASRKSSGGNEGEGVQSYTATVLHAAKSLGRGLRELGDAVASSLTGNPSSKLGTSPNSPQAGGSSDVSQKGIVTVLDIENPLAINAEGTFHPEIIIAHFVAHTEAIVSLEFDACGMLLLTADKRGHDFNLFRINPHPIGSSLAAVHHLYTLHRGDTSAKVQDMSFSFDSRWVAVSTLRGTTHVFPVTPYGGNIGVRTHTTPHVVNKMSRFHRSAGLNVEGRSNSPVSTYDNPVSPNFPYHNPRFSPFPHPTVVNPLAQLRQPVYMQNIGNTVPRQGRQRLTSSSEDNIALRVAVCFAPARDWIDSTSTLRDTLSKNDRPVESLFVVSCHGTLVQYDLDPRPASNIPKDRISDDSPIELVVTAKAQWRLQRQATSVDRPLPLSPQSLIFVSSAVPILKKKQQNGNDDDWLSQVEIITHAGPHRRLWMGPQFTFKTYTTTNGTPMSLADARPLDLNRSKPVNMPITKANAVLIESSSASSSEQSLLDMYRKSSEELGAAGEHQIKEDLADAMLESPGGVREGGGRCVLVSMKSQHPPQRVTTAPSPIAKVVNPLGTVVTVQSNDENEVVIPEDIIIYENCDETLFRPMVTPKTLAYCISSKVDAGNIMMQSLRNDTEVTVRVIERTEEHIEQLSSWEDPKFQDIKINTNVIVRECEVSDLMVQNMEQSKAVSSRNQNKKREPDSETRGCFVKDVPKFTDDTTDSKFVRYDSLNLEICSPREDFNSESIEIDCSKNVSGRLERESDKKSRIITNKSHPENANIYDKTTYNYPKNIDDKTRNDNSRLELEETSFGLVNPLYNALDDCDLTKEERLTLKTKDKENTSDISSKDKSLKQSLLIPKAVKKSKNTNKKVNQSKIIDSNFEIAEINIESNKVKESFLMKENTNKSKAAKRSVEEKPSKSRILEDLESVEELSFPALDNKLLNPEFPPLEENFFSLENLSKTEKFEDAQDCGLPLTFVETFYIDQSFKTYTSTEDHNKVIEVGGNEFISTGMAKTSEETIDGDQKLDGSRKKTSKKPRKTKSKLGIKIGSSSKDGSPDRKISKELSTFESHKYVSAEINLPEQEISRATEASDLAKPSEVTRKNPWVNNNKVKPVFEQDIVEAYTITLPKKSYSSVITEKLLDIETPEEREEISNVLTRNLLEIESERSTGSGTCSVQCDRSPDLLKLSSDKSSDDEKNESGSSPFELTESSDEVIGISAKLKSVDGDTTMSSKSKNSKVKLKKKKK